MSDHDPATDHYTTLGLNPPTTTQAVQAAFLAKKGALGPPSSANASVREALDLAFYHLSDVVRRAQYDKARERSMLAQRAAAAEEDDVFAAAAAAAATPSGPASKPKADGKITAYEAATPGGLAMLEARIADFPEDLDSMSFLAFQYYSSGAFDKSAQTYSRYLRKKPLDADAHYYAGRAFQKINQVKFAIIHFRKVVEIAPGTERAEKSSEALRELGG